VRGAGRAALSVAQGRPARWDRAHGLAGRDTLDTTFWGCLCALAAILMLGGLVALLAFGAHEHSAPVIALCGSVLGLIAVSVIAKAWRDYREYHPREHREVQKGARWP
jgi:hypothetical protein